MGFVKARGSKFYYEEQGDGPPILLIPPAGSTASTWGTLVGDLAGAGRVIAYDRRGYTRSGGEVVRSAAAHTRDAAAVLESSMGGYPRAQDLATNTAPVVCTYGSRSRSYMRPLTRSLARAIPTARACEIDGAAHAVPFDALGNFAQVIVEAIRSGDGVQVGGT